MKEKPSQRKLVIIVVILLFASLTLLLHFVTAGISSAFGKSGYVQSQNNTSQTADNDVNAVAVDTITSGIAPDLQAKDQESEQTEDSEVSQQTQESEIDVLNTSVMQAELPSFNWASPDAPGFVFTPNPAASLEIKGGTLEDTVNGLKLECSDYSLTYTISDVANNNAASVQSINILKGSEVYTEVIAASSGGIVHFTINRTLDQDGVIYEEVRAFILNQYSLELPAAESIDPPSAASVSEGHEALPSVDEHAEPVIVR